jgi:hypothetical protein
MSYLATVPLTWIDAGSSDMNYRQPGTKNADGLSLLFSLLVRIETRR